MADAISTGLLSELSAREKYAPANTEKQELGQDVFLELMVTQMRNQNPLEPQDNSEFVAQLAWWCAWCAWWCACWCACCAWCAWCALWCALWCSKWCVWCTWCAWQRAWFAWWRA